MKKILYTNFVSTEEIITEMLQNKDIKKAINRSNLYKFWEKTVGKKFAEKLNSTLSYINQLENGKRKPTLELLDKFAEILDITSAELITYNHDHVILNKRIDGKK